MIIDKNGKYFEARFAVFVLFFLVILKDLWNFTFQVLSAMSREIDSIVILKRLISELYGIIPFLRMPRQCESRDWQNPRMDMLRRYFPYRNANTVVEDDDIDGPGANSRKIHLNSSQVNICKRAMGGLLVFKDFIRNMFF